MRIIIESTGTEQLQIYSDRESPQSSREASTESMEAFDGGSPSEDLLAALSSQDAEQAKAAEYPDASALEEEEIETIEAGGPALRH
jgi:hypothetical protein